MNKILISVGKEYLSFSKYNRNINEENLNNTNVIDIKSLKFTEEYILENLDLVSAFINLIVLKFNINKVIIKNLDIAETTLILIKNFKDIKYIDFKVEEELTYTISSLLLENKNIEKIECYSLPKIMFHRFNKNQVITKCEILTVSPFLEYNKIKTFSDLFNKEKIYIPEFLMEKDINPLVYFLENNKQLKKIEFKKYNKKNLEAVLFYLKNNDLKKIKIIIDEDESTTEQILNDIKFFDNLNKKFHVNIKIKYSKKYKDKNKIKELNIKLLKTTIITCIFVGMLLLIALKSLEKKDNKSIEKINDKVNSLINESNNIVSNDELIETNDPQYVSSYYQNYSKVYDELLSINEDTIGWITINNTNINYPVVQTKDNDYYLNHAYDKTKNIAGWIFVDYRNNLDNIDKNTIVYGHSGLIGNLMFSSLNKTLDKNWYTNEENLNIYFSIKGKEYTFKIFSIYTIDVTSDYLDINFNIDDDYMNFINKIKSRSIDNFNVEVTPNDKILTLSTCYKDDSKRLVVHAKMN